MTRALLAGCVAVCACASGGCFYAEIGVGGRATTAGEGPELAPEFPFGAGLAAEIPAGPHRRGVRIAVGAGGTVSRAGDPSTSFMTGLLALRADITIARGKDLLWRATGALEPAARGFDGNEVSGHGGLVGVTMMSPGLRGAFYMTLGAHWMRLDLPADTSHSGLGAQVRIGFEADVFGPLIEGFRKGMN